MLIAFIFHQCSWTLGETETNISVTFADQLKYFKMYQNILPCYLVVSLGITVPRQCCKYNLFYLVNELYETLPRLAMASGHWETFPCEECYSNQLFAELYIPRPVVRLGWWTDNYPNVSWIYSLCSLSWFYCPLVECYTELCWLRTGRAACFRAWIFLGEWWLIHSY